MLEERRRELLSEVQGKIRDVRAESGKERDVLDQGESSEVDIQEDIEFALIQMKSETLNKINEALRRLEEGTYGNCFECGDESPRSGCARFRSRSAARIAKRRGRMPSSASGAGAQARHRRRSSSTCPINRRPDRTPPVAAPIPRCRSAPASRPFAAAPFACAHRMR